jgi:hypothetical protein
VPDPLKDFADHPTVDVNYVLVVHPSLPVKSVPGHRPCKGQPGNAHGSAGSGSLPRLGTELFKAQTEVPTCCTSRTGAAADVIDLLGGNAAVIETANPPHKAMRRCGAPPDRRTRGLPDRGNRPCGLRRPGGARRSRGIAARHRQAPQRRVNQAYDARRARSVGGGLEAIGGTPEQFGRFIASEISDEDQKTSGRRPSGEAAGDRGRPTR